MRGPRARPLVPGGARRAALPAIRWRLHHGPVDVALAVAAAGLVALWGVAHAIPTRAVVAGFGPISPENRRVLVQEWLAEAVAMWSFAVLLVVVTAAGRGTAAAAWTYRVTAGALLALAVLTALTGARTRVAWFKICPVLLFGAAALLLAASLV